MKEMNPCKHKRAEQSECEHYERRNEHDSLCLYYKKINGQMGFWICQEYYPVKKKEEK